MSPTPAPEVEARADERVAVGNARWYFSGLAASLLGNSAMTLVAGIWVKELTGSSAKAGLVSACIYAGTMGAPIAGLVADRFPRRRLLLWLNVVAALTLLPLLVVSSHSGVWLLFVVMAAYGIEATLVGPAEDALFAQMFSVDFRRRITGWRLTIQETGRLVAPLLGAGLFVLIGGGLVASLDAATFVFAAFVITRLKIDDQRPARESERLITSLLAGGRHILGSTAIRPVAVATALVMALSALGVAAQYSLVRGVGEHPAFLGVFSALLGAGSIVASLTASRIATRHGERTLALIGLVNFAVGNLLRATHWLPSALLGTVVLGFALPYAFLAALNVAQRSTPDALQGRVSAALTFALFAPQAILQTAGSALITTVSYSEIYIGSAALSLLIAAWLTLQRANTGR